ncbi:MAG: DUF452 family protein [Chloroflexia bacterium]|nr:DUF452 family protein [Chloroflexia bacterium]
MNKLWLNKSGNKNCILFFNGWGMDENAVKHLNVDNYDVCMFYNYSSIENIEFDRGQYGNVYLVAWSLGVWAASVLINPEKVGFEKVIAINGTQIPKNETLGIHPTTFENTIKKWTPRNRDKFNMRILGGKDAFLKWNSLLSLRACEEQKFELEFINNQINDKPIHNIKFDYSIIGEKDLIFLHENQVNFWKGKTNLIEMDLPHYPFGNFTSWDQLIHL